MVETTRTNSNSVISLTLGILSILLPYIGLILGVIGVVISRKATKEVMKTDEDGGGLATAGLICSMVGIIIQIFLVVSIIVYYSLTNIA